MKEVKIGLLGCGTVGTGVAKILLERSELIRSRVGAKLVLKNVADLDRETDRGIRFEDGVFISDAFQVVDDPEIDIIVEMIGGETIAKKLMMRAIENGKHIVTANKALLAAHGNEIFQAASRKGVDIGFEASVGGCMPIIKTIRESLVGNRISEMTGILNGTCNYILSSITETGVPFADALRKAQEKGFAEADPTLDIEGFDTAHKLALLSSLAYGMELNLDDIYVEGISNIDSLDIEFAKQSGYTIKLLAISKFSGDSVEARVHPTMIPSGNLLSNVSGSLNAVSVTGDAVGEIILHGYGAGMMPTASAVIGDIVDIARNLMLGISNRIPGLSYQPQNIRKIPVKPMDDIMTHYYFRFSALDRPGVLARIAGLLGDHGISIQTVHQRGRDAKGAVPIVMVTHIAKEADVMNAMDQISSLDAIADTPVLIRIESDDMD
ncbi:MAG: homoserine dehydrogenase [Desulfobacteraceae bacterium]|nr:MAG: homoserine dehydrogenase [Desulfobacteraceae bacterium]